MKLIIQIPCYNEEETLPLTLSKLPRRVDGFDTVEWLVIDDGSIDRTTAVAVEYGVDHIVKLGVNKGLATAFMTGINAALKAGADIIVNTDADNQYRGSDIPKLVEPLLSGRSGFVIGIRPVYGIKEIPLLIKFLHKVGSVAVRLASGTEVSDPPSGFRAFSREVAAKLRVYNSYTYTLETIIQAGCSGIPIETVAVGVNMEKLRPSRLMTSPYSYVLKSSVIILRSMLLYSTVRFIFMLMLPILTVAAIFALFLYQLNYSLSCLMILLLTSAFLLFISGVVSPVIFSYGAYKKNKNCEEKT